MIPFPYQRTIKGRAITGTLYSHTGYYAGGKQSQAHGDESETIDVRDSNGKVQSATVNYIIDPPDNCTITLLYFQQGGRYRLFQIYLHETERFYGISDDIIEQMISTTIGITVLRKLWNKILSAVTLLLMVLCGFVIMAITRYQGYEGIASILCGFGASVLWLLLRPLLINLLGGTDHLQKAMRKQLFPLCGDLISSLPMQHVASQDGYNAM